MQAVLWTRRYPEFTHSAHERYGSTFTARIGGLPTSVVTVDRDVVRRIFTGDPVLKRHGNDLLRPVLGDRSVLLLEPSEHLERRKLLLPHFHGERVRAYSHLIRSLIEAELDRWREDEVLAVLPRAQNLTLEVILRAVLGIADPRMREQLREIYDSMIRIPGSALGFCFPQLQWIARSYWRKKHELDGILTEQIAATRSDPGLAGRDDILALLVQTRDERGEGLSDAELLAELNTLLVAGHETTATAIAWGAELLAHHPAVLERARRAVNDGEDGYTDALVKEILRIRPPIPVGAARHPVEPFSIGEFTVDPSVAIIVNAWGVHHDSALYPKPEVFRPERFVDQAADSYAFVPFGGGAHRCLGAALAQLEIKIVLGAIISHYDLEPVDAQIAGPVRRAIALVPRGGGRVRLAGLGTAQHRHQANSQAPQ